MIHKSNEKLSIIRYRAKWYPWIRDPDTHLSHTNIASEKINKSSNNTAISYTVYLLFPLKISSITLWDYMPSKVNVFYYIA